MPESPHWSSSLRCSWKLSSSEWEGIVPPVKKVLAIQSAIIIFYLFNSSIGNFPLHEDTVGLFSFPRRCRYSPRLIFKPSKQKRGALTTMPRPYNNQSCTLPGKGDHISKGQHFSFCRLYGLQLPGRVHREKEY